MTEPDQGHTPPRSGNSASHTGNARQNVQSSAIDVRDVLAGVWRRKRFISLVTFLAAAGSVAFVNIATPVYLSEAKIIVENLGRSFTSPQAVNTQTNQVDELDVLSQVEVLKSQDLAKAVIAKLNLIESDEFDPLRVKGPGLLSRILIMIGFKADPRKQTAEQRVLKSYYDMLTVYQVPRSRVIVIDMNAEKPETAAKVVNTLANSYIKLTREVESTTTSRARVWLEDQIKELRKKVVSSEAAAEVYRAKFGLLKGRDVNATLNSQELSELNSQIILAEAARSEAQARAAAIRDLLRKTGTIDGSTAVLNSSLIQRLREQQIALKRSREQLSATYLPNHPRIIAVNKEIVNLDRQVRAEALKIVQGLEQQAKIASTRVASLRASMNGLKTRASASNQDGVKLRALERESTATRTLLETFLTRYSDASARQNIEAQPGRARIISTAAPASEAAFPKKGPIVILTTIAGLVLSLGLAFLAEVMGAAGRMQQSAQGAREFDARVEPAVMAPVTTPAGNGADSASAHSTGGPGVPGPVAPATAPTSAPAIAPSITPASTPANTPAPAASPSLCEIPRIASDTNGFSAAISVVNEPDGVYARAVRPLSSWAVSLRQTLGLNRLAVLAQPASGRDGATLIAAMARLMAGQSSRVIIVDTVANSPLNAVMSVPLGRGLFELLSGQASFSDVILRDVATQVHILRAGIDTSNAAGLLSSERLEKALEALDHTYDLVLVHTGSEPASAVMCCKAALVVTSPEQAAETAVLVAALEKSGMRAVQYARTGAPLSADTIANEPMFPKLAAGE